MGSLKSKAAEAEFELELPLATGHAASHNSIYGILKLL